ncbi:protein of unknown function [Paraburkholderia kururiensis]
MGQVSGGRFFWGGELGRLVTVVDPSQPLDACLVLGPFVRSSSHSLVHLARESAFQAEGRAFEPLLSRQ